MTGQERLQALLRGIRDHYCDGKQAELARRIGRDANYVSRLFYPPGKAGAKGIGPEIMEACRTAFQLPPGFWEQDPERAFPTSTVPERLREVMATQSWDEAALGSAIEAGSEAVAGLLTRPAVELPLPIAARLATYSPYSVRWLQTGVGKKAARVMALEEIEQGHTELGPLSLPSLVPISGFAMMGDDGFFEYEGAATPEGFVPYVKARGVYALRVRGASMMPAIGHGSIVVVDAEGKLIDNAKVAIALKDGRKLVKKLLSHKGGFLEVESVNGGQVKVYRPDEVESAHPVRAVFEPSAVVDSP